MIIQKTRINNPEKYISKKYLWKQINIWVILNEKVKKIAREIGFDKNLTNDSSIIPGIIGPISDFNMNGRYKKRKDLPKEKYEHELPWWPIQDRGWHRHSWVNYIPRERYQREYLPWPGIRLQISWEKIISWPFLYTSENSEKIKHTINLYLEIFWICVIFDKHEMAVWIDKIITVNRDILPQWEYPREKIEKQLSLFAQKRKWKNRLFQERLEKIWQYNPSFTAIGRWGFNWYVIFAFNDRNLYVLESMFLWNATYIFENERESLSQLTKKDILINNYQKDRIIHNPTRENNIELLFKKS